MQTRSQAQTSQTPLSDNTAQNPASTSNQNIENETQNSNVRRISTATTVSAAASALYEGPSTSQQAALINNAHSREPENADDSMGTDIRNIVGRLVGCLVDIYAAEPRRRRRRFLRFSARRRRNT